MSNGGDLEAVRRTFIGHAGGDTGFARSLAKELRDRGFACSTSGDTAAGDRPAAISSSLVLILVASLESTGWDDIAIDLLRANDEGIPVVVIDRDGVFRAGGPATALAQAAKIDVSTATGVYTPAGIAKQIGDLIDPRRARKRRWKWAVEMAALIAVYTAITFGFLFVDPFGLKSLSERSWQRIFYYVIAPAYGVGRFAARAPGVAWTRQITVISVDDLMIGMAVNQPSSEQDGEGGCIAESISWPVPLCVHGVLLRRIHELYRPQAIVIPVLFLDERRKGQVEYLARVLESIEAEGKTQVFLADHDDVLQPLKAHTQPINVIWTDKNKTGSPGLYYPLSTGAGPDANEAGAAFTVYEHLCEVSGEIGCASQDERSEAFERPMQLYWGSRAPKLNRMQQDQNVACKSMSRTPLNAFASYAWLTLSGEAEKLWQTCPYSQVIHARYLLKDSFRNNEIIKSAFRSVPNGGQAELPRIVFYGTDFFAASDPIDSPTHHTVAGVYYHAMALDNLLTLGTNYTKAISITSQLNESVGRWFRELDSLNPDRIHKNQDGLNLGYLLYSLISIYFILSMILLNRHLKDSEIYKSESKFKFYGYHKNNRYFSSIVLYIAIQPYICRLE